MLKETHDALQKVNRIYRTLVGVQSFMLLTAPDPATFARWVGAQEALLSFKHNVENAILLADQELS